MRLVRHGPAGRERPGLIDADGRIRDLSGRVADIGGDALIPEGQARLRRIDADDLPVVAEGTRLGPPVAAVGKVICIGLNYACNARALGQPAPDEPAMSMKPPSVLAGAGDGIVLPRGSVATDWEVELAVVIGRPARYVTEEDARGHVAGYCLANDLSERDDQRHRGGDSSKGRGHDGFGPLGPWLLTADEVADPQDIRLWLEIDGERVQDGTTADMLWGVDRLVAYLSRFTTLLPGDVIFSGTPAGIGIGCDPPRFLKAGQRVRLGGTGLGEQDGIVA